MCLRPIIGHLDLGDKAVVTYDGGNHYTVDYVRHIEEPEAVEDYEARP